MDPGAIETDKLIAELEERIRVEYEQTKREIEQKLNDYTRAYRIKDRQWQTWVENDEKSKQDYIDWKTEQIAVGQRWEEMRDTIAQDLLNANKIALSIARDYMPEAYAINHDYGTYQIEHDSLTDTSYTLYNRAAAENAFRDDFQVLPGPGKKVSQDIADGKALRWNNRHIQSAMMQAILQGNSIPDIATRLANAVGDSDEKAAIRNARTMMTNAQNSGRLDSFKRARDMGIKVSKQWVATLDSRTRHEHRLLDGMIAPLDEPFKVEGEEIMKPGDPNAPAHLVYNCFVGSDIVSTDSEVIRSYKYWYEGELIHVETASGVNFTCTPNHPILTPNGWVAVALLNNGDDVLITGIADDSITTGRESNINHVHTSFEAFHNALKRFGLVRRDSPLGINFHGDIPASDVEIVTKERKLGSAINTCGSNGINKFLLKNSYESFVSKGTLFQHLRGIWQASLGLVCRFGKMLTAFWRSVGHPKIHGFGTVTGRDVGIPEYTIDNLPTTTVIRSELLHGLAGKVFVDNIVTVYKMSGSTHVYNLQTENGYYIVGYSIPKPGRMYNGKMGIIAKNCRCTMIGSLKGHERDLSDTSLRYNKKLGEMSYEEWKEAKAKSKPITASKDMSSEIRADYIREYRGYGGPVKSGWNTELDIDSKNVQFPQQEQAVQARPMVDGQNLIGQWEWNKEKYKFAIEDIVHAQGYDGLPQVVNQETLDAIVQQSGMIAQRVYLAPDQQTLDAYRDGLLNGAWYVDCSIGGATKGQGMYTSSDYTGTLSDGVKADMQQYLERGVKRYRDTLLDGVLDGLSDDEIKAITGADLSHDDIGVLKRCLTEIYEDQRTHRIPDHSGEDWDKYESLRKYRWSIDAAVSEKTDAYAETNPPVSKIETMTMDPSAKIIKLDDLYDEMKQNGYIGDKSDMDLRWGRYKYMDPGVYAAASGYDAINAEGYGESGSYTIILNRTKTYILE